MCILNGRNYVNNDFTSISTKGLAVVDYCLVTHDHLSMFSDFTVIRALDGINKCEHFNSVVSSGIPDHSILTWCLNVDCTLQSNGDFDQDNVNNTTKFDIKSIPDIFLLDVDILNKVNTAIADLEGSLHSQTDIDIAFTGWCNTVEQEMRKRLPSRSVHCGINNKKRRNKKPWWNDTLTLLWNSVCFHEKEWINCKVLSMKHKLKSDYCFVRKSFDREVQRSKRLYWYKLQEDLLDEVNNDPHTFWKSIGKVGINNDKKKIIPMEVLMEDGSLSSDVKDVLIKWERDYSNLLNNNYSNVSFSHSNNAYSLSDTVLDDNISILEVKRAVDGAKKCKAAGIDNIPIDVLKNETSILFLHVLFNVCFDSGCVPSLWGKTIINPIPKSGSVDPRDPLSYRGIALASSMYKLYTAVLNNRITLWSDRNDKLVDEQNGFRKKRSTIDHVSSLTNIIETRKKLKQSTFCAFIDFQKAYDFINRDKLWERLANIGVSDKMLKAVKSLYNSVSSCVKINNHFTNWFNVNSGLRQGCPLSPLLFNLFINDLALRIKALGKGIDINQENISILLYADDIVLLSENEDNLQFMLNELNSWCTLNNMSINVNKSNIVHFRPCCIPRTEFVFNCGINNINLSEKYVYLGLTLNEFLDYNVTAKIVAQSAGRALGLLIAKFKALGGMPFDVFKKLFDSLVWSVISYGAAIWGTKSYSCINAIQNRAMRFYLGTGKYTPTAALFGDMGWTPPLIKQWKCICTHWSRNIHTDVTRLNKRIFTWAYSKADARCKNWFYAVKCNFDKLDLLNLYDIYDTTLSKNNVIDSVYEKMMTTYIFDWKSNVNRITSVTGNGRNKLRTYRLYKSDYNTEQYCKTNLPLKHRSAFAKFRCGVAPLRIETGRYENIPESNRLCPYCVEFVEDEYHVMLNCDLYIDERRGLLFKANEITPDFSNLNECDKMKFLFSNKEMIRFTAKTCFNILRKRNFYLYK